jgi:hypothetical protein
MKLKDELSSISICVVLARFISEESSKDSWTFSDDLSINVLEDDL